MGGLYEDWVGGDGSLTGVRGDHGAEDAAASGGVLGVAGRSGLRVVMLR